MTLRFVAAPTCLSRIFASRLKRWQDKCYEQPQSRHGCHHSSKFTETATTAQRCGFSNGLHGSPRKLVFNGGSLIGGQLGSWLRRQTFPERTDRVFDVRYGCLSFRRRLQKLFDFCPVGVVDLTQHEGCQARIVRIEYWIRHFESPGGRKVVWGRGREVARQASSTCISSRKRFRPTCSRNPTFETVRPVISDISR